MAISDHDRKILWNAAHGKCAKCRHPLVRDRTEGDKEAVIGEEAHIVARRESGPRGGQIHPSLVDRHENLILLCPTCHTEVDAQPQRWTVEELHGLKARHQSWAQSRLDRPDELRIVAHPDDPDDPTGDRPWRVNTGEELWTLVAGADSYFVDGLEDDEIADPELVEHVDAMLQEVTDWGEMESYIGASMQKVREAKRRLSVILQDAHELGLMVFGTRRRRLMTGGVSPDSDWADVYVVVVRQGDPAIRWASGGERGGRQ